MGAQIYEQMDYDSLDFVQQRSIKRSVAAPGATSSICFAIVQQLPRIAHFLNQPTLYKHADPFLGSLSRTKVLGLGPAKIYRASKRLDQPASCAIEKCTSLSGNSCSRISSVTAVCKRFDCQGTVLERVNSIFPILAHHFNVTNACLSSFELMTGNSQLRRKIGVSNVK